MEAMGEALLLRAVLRDASCLAAAALDAAGSAAQQAEWLGRIAGERAQRSTARARSRGASRARAWRDSARDRRRFAAARGGDFMLDGAVRHVVDGHCAELLVVAARAPGARGRRRSSRCRRDAGPRARALPTMDQTRRLAELRFDGVRVPARARLGAEGGAGPALERALDLGAIALAAEQVGGAQRCLDLAVAYAKERVQFGRPIGSFQAIKHKCADMLVQRRVGALGGVLRRRASRPSRAPSVSQLAASLAKACGSDAYFRCAGERLQIHGGVGFTWEYDVHLYFKRARASAALARRRRLASRAGRARIGLGE